MKSLWPVSALVPLLLTGVMSAGAAERAMQPLDDAQLAGVTGREGIALDLSLGVNMEPDDNGDFVISSGLGDCDGNVECRLALEFQGRPDKWLVLKDYHGFMEFNNLELDATTLQNSDSPHRDDQPFRDAVEGGSCLLSGCDPNGLPALQIGYPDTQPAANDFSMFVEVGRLAAEFDSGTTPGYMRDAASGSVLGFRASRVGGGAAAMNIDGHMMVYGF